MSSPHPGELVITWDAPSDVPDDYRVTWKKSTAKWPSYKNDNTVEGGNAFPTGTSHTVSDLEEGTEYHVRVRARYYNGNGDVEQSGQWSQTAPITISSSPPAKPTGLSTSPSHDSVLLSWTDPSDSGITGYQVLRGPDADNLTVLTDDTANTNTSYTDDSVTAETTYVYATKARNSGGLSPQSDTVSTTTLAAPPDPPAKPTITGQGATHSSADLYWANPNDDSITDYQILRGDDTDSLTILTDNTGNTNTNYNDDTVEAAKEYAYAIRARNAGGLSPQSDTVSVTTQAAPEEHVTELALAGAEFTLDGQTLDTTGTCNKEVIGDIADACTINIDTKTPVFAVDGTLDSDDRLTVKTGRDKLTVDAATESISEGQLRGADQTVTLPLPEGTSLMRLWGDDDEVAGGEEEHFFRVNVVPYWESNGDRLSKNSGCQSATDRTVTQITDTDCILTQIGNTAELQFRNVLEDHYNVYVDVNGTTVVDEPDNTVLAGSFTLDLQHGDNVIRVRLASKTGAAETYSSNAFYYKITTTPPAKPTGLSTSPSHDSVLLSWTDPNDDSITGYQILRGSDAANLAVLTDDTANTNTSYTDDTVDGRDHLRLRHQGPQRQRTQPAVGHRLRHHPAAAAGQARGPAPRHQPQLCHTVLGQPQR